MNKFNKLYNNILNIITEGRADRQRILSKSQFKDQIMNFLQKGKFDNKTATLLAKYYASGELRSFKDPKIEQVKIILAKDPSIDIQKNIPLDQFISQHSNILRKVEILKPSYADSFSQFTNKKKYRSGIVVYDVQNSRSGQEAVRQVVDDHLGFDTNPWCLIARDNSQNEYGEMADSAWSNWRQYDGVQKKIAFQHGKLLAFCANYERRNMWWNLQDKPSDLLIDFNGKEVEGTGGESYLLTLVKKNQQTGRYDCDGNLIIQSGDLVDFKIPIPLGVIKGNFVLNTCRKISTLENGPTRVEGNCDITYNNCLQSLVGGPKYVGGWFKCDYCNSLKNLQGAPEYVGKDFSCSDCQGLVNLKGAPKYIGGDFWCCQCSNLQNLIGAPEQLKGSFSCNRGYKLQSLQGAPRKVDGNFDISICGKLIDLKGSPDYVGGTFRLFDCQNLTTLEGISKHIGKDLRCEYCRNLTYADGLTHIGHYMYIVNTKLESKQSNGSYIMIYGNVDNDLFSPKNYKNQA